MHPRPRETPRVVDQWTRRVTSFTTRNDFVVCTDPHSPILGARGLESRRGDRFRSSCRGGAHCRAGVAVGGEPARIPETPHTIIDVHLILVRDDQIFLTKRKCDTGDGMWHLPSGKASPDRGRGRSQHTLGTGRAEGHADLATTGRLFSFEDGVEISGSARGAYVCIDKECVGRRRGCPHRAHRADAPGRSGARHRHRARVRPDRGARA